MDLSKKFKDFVLKIIDYAYHVGRSPDYYERNNHEVRVFKDQDALVDHHAKNSYNFFKDIFADHENRNLFFRCACNHGNNFDDRYECEMLIGDIYIDLTIDLQIHPDRCIP